MKKLCILMVLFFTFSSPTFAQKDKENLLGNQQKKMNTLSQKKSIEKMETIKIKLKWRLDKKIDYIDKFSLQKRGEVYDTLISKIHQLIQDENISLKNKSLLKLVKEIVKERKGNLK